MRDLKAADQGYARITDAKGESVPLDYATAATWFHKAADQSEPDSWELAYYAADALPSHR